MEEDDVLLTVAINPNNFPAKFWRLVNSPLCGSLRWDASGDGVIIDQQMFEAELLSPSKDWGDHADVFKTTNFTSFIRQLNLYGFKKTDLGYSSKLKGGDITVTKGVQHHFHNPNFKQGHPELLVNMKRLTSVNKAKIVAGLQVKCRPPNRLRRKSLETKCGAMHVGLTLGDSLKNSVSPCQFNRNDLLHMKSCDGNPVSQFSWLMSQRDSSSSATFFPEKGIPVSVVQHMLNTSFDSPCSVQTGLSSMHAYQGHQSTAAAELKYDNIMPHYTQFRQGFYASVYPFCSQGSLNIGVTGYVAQPPSQPHYTYYQPNYPVGFVHPGNQDWLSNENSEAKKNDISLDTVFQTADEFQASPKLFGEKANSTENPIQIITSKLLPSTISSNLTGYAQDISYYSYSSNSLHAALGSSEVFSYGSASVCEKINAVPANPMSCIDIAHNSLANSETDAKNNQDSNESLPLDFSQKVL